MAAQVQPLSLADEAETVVQAYLYRACGNPSEALRILARHSLEERAEYDQAIRWCTSHGYVRGGIPEASTRA